MKYIILLLIVLLNVSDAVGKGLAVTSDHTGEDSLRNAGSGVDSLAADSLVIKMIDKMIEEKEAEMKEINKYIEKSERELWEARGALNKTYYDKQKLIEKKNKYRSKR